MSAAIVIAGVLMGCSGSSDLDPIVGRWTATGPQPTGYADFADGALISVDEDGTATLGSSPMSMCGDAAVEATEGSDGEGQRFRIAFPKKSSCVTVEVPSSLDVVVDGDSMTATPTGSPNAHFRFGRAG
ncbi:hypothetical protein [Streptomyces atratus]|nr:hypothetical protein [Streptomyces atratus]